VKLSVYVVVFLLWVGAFFTSSIMAYSEFISLWYLPAGVSTAAFLIFGKRAFLPIFFAVFIVSFRFAEQFSQGFDPAHLATALLFALAHTLPYGFGGLTARYWLSHFIQNPLSSKIVGVLVIYSVSALLAAFSGLSVWQLAEGQQNVIASGWFAWWLGDLIGVMVITPILALLFPKIAGFKLAWLEPFFAHDKGLSRTPRGFLTKLSVAVITIIGIMLLDHSIQHPGVAYFIFFVSIPQLWIVFTEKTSYASLSLLIITSLMAVGVNVFGVTDQAITYQFALYMTAATAYFAVAVPALMQQNNTLKELAMLDIKTNLPTQWLFKTLVNQVVKSSRPNQNHCIALYNLDHFSQLNQDYGESIGDEVIKQSAHIMQTAMRDSEILSHSEADNFLVFMPNIDIEQGFKRATELRHTLPVLHVENLILPIRGSFGVVQVQFGEEIEQTIERATEAMRQAKQNGRNKVVALS